MFVNFKKIKKEIYSLNAKVNLIVVSKNQPFEALIEILKSGHNNFGENKVQEALQKWLDKRVDYTDLRLHMIGRVQSNKVKDIVKLFDFVHSLDSIKLAREFKEEEQKCGKKLKYFIQVNLAEESQKAGVRIQDLQQLINFSTSSPPLEIVGLMCFPPFGSNPCTYFEKIKELTYRFKFNEISMGMSSDYHTAIKYGSTYVRIGTAIFN